MWRTCHGLSNFFGIKLQQEYPITMATMAYLLRMNNLNIFMTHSRIRFSRVCDQNHNAQADRAIQTIMYMVFTFMVHNLLHWKDRGTDDLYLWSFVVKHSVWLYNCLPNKESGLTPLKFFDQE